MIHNLETERVLLRPFDVEDTDFILNLLNSEGWIRFIGDRKIHSTEAAKNYLLNGPLKSYRENGFGLCLAILKSTKTPIGMCGLIRREGLPEPDLGFAFLPEYHGKGLAFEIANACLNHTFYHIAAERILAITLPENKRSIGLLEKLGMRFEKTIILPGEKETLWCYTTAKKSLNRPPFYDFPVIQGNLVTLRNIEPNEVESVMEILFYNQRAASDLCEAKKILSKVDFHYREGTGINWGIISNDTGEIAGTIGFYRGFENAIGEIGFVTKESYRRKGLTSESIKLLVDFGYRKMQLRKIQAFTKPTNQASQKLLEKSGFVSDKIMTGDYFRFIHTR